MDLEFEIRKVIGIANYSKKRQFRNTGMCAGEAGDVTVGDRIRRPHAYLDELMRA